MVALAVVAVALAFALVARRRSRTYRLAAGLALAAHLVFALVVLPLLPYTWDIGTFHEIATGLLEGAEAGPLSSLDAFGTVQALVYASFGADPTTMAVVNGLVAVLTPLPACYLARRLYDPLESTDGLLLALLFLPFPFLFASLPMRDALSTLLALTLLAVCVRAVADRRHRWALAAPPLWGMVFLLREELAFLVLLGAAGSLLVAALRRVTDRQITLASLALAGLPVAVAGFALFTRLFPVDALNSRLQYRIMGGAAYLGFERYGSWLDVLLAAPVRAIYFQFAPFPLHVDSAFDLLAVLSLPLLVVLATAAYLTLRRVEHDPVVTLPLLVVYLGGIVGYGLIDSNFGTTIRHRSFFVFLLAVFAAPALESWWRSLRVRVEKPLRQGRDRDEHQRETEELDARA
ncbi:glycosyltransferase family 39 protein [Halosimplex pelagicum]|uniref:Glycosyltransferase family 39 protein n=1 Tax=Halosimplex pelagicum TaxID=869886 RepID=A0A7D5PA96_9EURY|nr:glycosyltransferase family 39 protein [Halosimplex pelagicum]QLH81402.1 glycosyltransferase family 39 protein [Halosimplex pelagicum]